jgi:ribosome-associated translation inhibitor RaiA
MFDNCSLVFSWVLHRIYMVNKIPLYVTGLPKDEPANGLLASKFGNTLEKVQQVLPDIIEAKIDVKSQNTEGTRTHYDVTSVVITQKDRLVHTESGWDILKIADELCRKLEGEMSKHDNKRQRESIRKKEDY